MTYDEIKKEGEKNLKDLLALSHITDHEKEMIIIGFAQGFLAGELNEMKKRFEQLSKKIEK